MVHNIILALHCYKNTKRPSPEVINSKEIPQSETSDKPTAP